jgi:hypothetical protein
VDLKIVPFQIFKIAPVIFDLLAKLSGIAMIQKMLITAGFGSPVRLCI